jgi:hypothetical protein
VITIPSIDLEILQQFLNQYPEFIKNENKCFEFIMRDPNGIISKGFFSQCYLSFYEQSHWLEFYLLEYRCYSIAMWRIGKLEYQNEVLTLHYVGM